MSLGFARAFFVYFRREVVVWGKYYRAQFVSLFAAAAARGGSRGGEEIATALAASFPPAAGSGVVGIVTAAKAAAEQEGTAAADSLTEEFCESDKFDSRCIAIETTTGYPQRPSPSGHPCTTTTGQQTGRRRPDR